MHQIIQRLLNDYKSKVDYLKDLMSKNVDAQDYFDDGEYSKCLRVLLDDYKQRDSYNYRWYAKDVIIKPFSLLVACLGEDEYLKLWNQFDIEDQIASDHEFSYVLTYPDIIYTLDTFNLSNNLFTSISSGIFSRLTNIKSFTLGAAFKHICIQVVSSDVKFENCKTIDLSESDITVIHKAEIEPFKAATKIKLPKKLIKIDSYALINLTELKQITIPTSVELIGLNAFNKNSDIKIRIKRGQKIKIASEDKEFFKEHVEWY